MRALRRSDLSGRTILTAGLGGMGGAQPLAATMAGAAILCVEVDQRSIDRRLETRYVDEQAPTLDEALERIRGAAAERRPLSVALRANAADVFPELVARGERLRPRHRPDRRPRPPDGLHPGRGAVRGSRGAPRARPGGVPRLASESIVAHVRAMLEFVRMGCYVFDYGNNLRGEAYRAGLTDAFTYPGFVPAYIRPLFCRGIGPFRWAALSGDPRTSRRSTRLEGAVPRRHAPPALARAGTRARRVPGPAGSDLLARLRRPATAGLAINDLVRAGKVSAPVVIGRDHLDSGSVASPYRETEAMRDGSDAIADWPILNALLNTAAGATWVSVHHGGGVGIGNSIHAGMVVVADGTDDAADVSSGCSQPIRARA